MKVVAIPKTMDNDVPGTDYCIGFSTCVTRTIELTNRLRTSAGSHERLMILEVFGRYAGFSAMVPTLAGAAHRCVIPEYKFSLDLLTELLVLDRRRNPSRYAIVLVSEGAMPEGRSEMMFEDETADAFGHKKLGGIGDYVSREVKARSAKFNNGKTDRHHQPEPGIPGALRRSRRHRLSGTHGIRQSCARPDAEQELRQDGRAAKRPLSQRSH